MERSRSLIIALTALAALFMLACTENPVGRKCFLGGADAGESTAVIASPALECPSRTCLQVPLSSGAEPPEGSEYTPMCTAECSDDSDCDRVPESPCVSGFTCAVPVVVGPFCCRKMCVCKDFLVIPEGGLQTPAACDPSNDDNTCCNLPGRDDLDKCQ